MRTLGRHTAYHSTVALRVETVDGHDVVMIAGQLDMNTHAYATDQILGDPELRQPVLVLDLSPLDFLDSSGIRALVLLHRGLVASHTRLVFVTDSGHVRKLLKISGLDQVIAVHDTVTQAMSRTDEGGAEEPATAG